jgi:hypothetical protein
MPRARRPLRAIPVRCCPRAATLLLVAGALLVAGCGYQIALQPSPTPGALGVRQIAGLSQPQPTASAQVELAAVLAQAVQAAPALVAAQGAAQTQTASAPAPAPAPARGTLSLEPISAGNGAVTLPRATTAGAAIVPTASPTVSPPAPSATPRAVATAISAPAATLTPTPPAAPTASATPRPSPVQVLLAEGNNDFLYVGPTLPVDQALAALAGMYTVVSFRPAGATTQVTYRPGLDPVPVLPQNTLVHIGMKRTTTFVMYPPR